MDFGIHGAPPSPTANSPGDTEGPSDTIANSFLSPPCPSLLPINVLSFCFSKGQSLWGSFLWSQKSDEISRAVESEHFFQFFSSSSSSVSLPRPGIREESKGPAVRGSQSPSPVAWGEGEELRSRVRQTGGWSW